jgi:hypothetical protein
MDFKVQFLGGTESAGLKFEEKDVPEISTRTTINRHFIFIGFIYFAPKVVFSNVNKPKETFLFDNKKLEKYNTSNKLGSLILQFILKPYVFLNFHISIISVGIVYLFSYYTLQTIESNFYLFISTSTFAYYNFHWFFSIKNPIHEREKWASKFRFVLLVASLTALVFAGFLILKNPVWIIYFIPTSISGMAYTFFSVFLFQKFTPRFKAFYICVFWIYTLVICPILIYGIKPNVYYSYIISALLIFCYTLIITITFEIRDLTKNEFNVSPETLSKEETKLKRLRNEILFLLLIVSSFSFTISLLVGCIQFILYLLFLASVLIIKPKHSWFAYDFILDIFLVLSVASNLYFIL